MIKTVQIIRQKLLDNSFTGLHHDSDCGCECADLAPCGAVGRGENGYINGCSPGYKHFDPRPGHVENGDFAVRSQKETPSAEQWDKFQYN